MGSLIHPMDLYTLMCKNIKPIQKYFYFKQYYLILIKHVYGKLEPSSANDINKVLSLKK